MIFWERLVAFNKKMNNLPRKILLITMVLLSCYVIIMLFPLFAPFFVAGAIAALMEPMVRLFRRMLGKLKFKNALATMLAMIIIYGLVGIVSFNVVRVVVRELISLARSMPEIVRYISGRANELIVYVTENFAEFLPANFDDLFYSSLQELIKTLTSFAGTITRSAAGGAFATAFTLPEVILTIVLTIMGTFYLSYDKERIFAFFRRSFPASVIRGAVSLKNNILSSVFGQVKSQLIVSALITVAVTAGLVIMRRPYGVIMGILIGVADALPVIGAGLFLITWSVLSFITGETVIGVGMLILYLFVILVRQVSEPRIVGHNLGLYPLATMMALYAGFKLMGFLGMLAGPIILNVLKVVLAADEGLIPPPNKTLRPLLFKGKRLNKK